FCLRRAWETPAPALFCRISWHYRAPPSGADLSAASGYRPCAGTAGRSRDRISREGEMANKNHRRGWRFAVAGAAVLAISTAVAPPASAQDTGTRITAD